MEWYEIVSLVVASIIGLFIRDYVYKNKYKWRNDSWKNRKK